MAPQLPEAVAHALEHEKVFTNKADVPTVAGIYRRFFEAVAPSVERLDYTGCGWTDHQALECSKALPHFVSLRSLDFHMSQAHDVERGEGVDAIEEFAKGRDNFKLNGISFSR